MYTSDHIITSKHYLVLFVAAFAIGIFLAARLGIIFSLLLMAIMAISATLIFILLKITKKLSLKYIVLTFVLITASILGIFRIYTAQYLYTNSIREYEGQEVWLCGTITSTPRLSSSGRYHTFELDVFGINNKTGYFGTITMFVPQNCDCSFNFGTNIYAWTKIEKPESFEGASTFDYYTYLRGKNIFLTGTTKNINELSKLPAKHPWVTLKKAGGFVRSKITDSIDALFAGDNISAATLKGILIGDKSGFDDELYKKFSYSGISHIVAVSGLHISILFSFLLILANAFSSKRRLHFLITIPFIILFMSASGFTPSVCRASIMVMVMILSTFIREEYDPVTALFSALGLILAVVPYALFSKSLILSFTATLGIFTYSPYINKFFFALINSPQLRLKNHKLIKKVISYFLYSFSLSFSSFVGTAYFLSVFFDSVSLVQFFTNLWTIPLVLLIFCFGYICCLFYYIFPLYVMNVLKLPLTLCLEIIKLTINTFGTSSYGLNISGKNSDPVYSIIYFSIALIVYRLIKTIKDVQAGQKEKNIE